MAAAAGAGAWACLGPGSRGWAALGLAAAWGATTASIAVLAAFGGESIKSFLRAFGAGVALRAGALALLAAATWGRGWDVQAPLLGAYALGTLGLLTLEVRHLRSETRQ